MVTHTDTTHTLSQPSPTGIGYKTNPSPRPQSSCQTLTDYTQDWPHWSAGIFCGQALYAHTYTRYPDTLHWQRTKDTNPGGIKGAQKPHNVSDCALFERQQIVASVARFMLSYMICIDFYRILKMIHNPKCPGQRSRPRLCGPGAKWLKT